MSASKHSQLAPSSAHRWLACPGSVALESAAPEPPSSSYALEGTAAHLLCELRLSGVLSARALTQAVGQLIKEAFPDQYEAYTSIADILITEEMINSVQEYELFVRSQLPAGVSSLNRNFVRLEERVATGFLGVEGTADCVIIDWPDCLHVIDFKYGVRQVEAILNPQLAIYALGAIKSFGDDFETIKLSIVQPRGGGDTVRTFEAPLAKFKAKWTRKIEKGLAEIEQKPKLYRHGDHCRYCKGVQQCGRVTRATSTLARESAKPVPKEAKALARVLALETAVLERFNQCKQAAFELLAKGEEVPGYKLVRTFGRTTWKDDEEAGLTMGRVLLQNDIEAKPWKNPQPITPAQVKKILRVKQLPEDLEKLTHTPDRGLKVVPDTDKRPEYEPPLIPIGNADEEGI